MIKKSLIASLGMIIIGTFLYFCNNKTEPRVKQENIFLNFKKESQGDIEKTIELESESYDKEVDIEEDKKIIEVSNNDKEE